jgi:hypothetical protein
VATVNSAGLVTGVSAGSAEISATYQNVTAVSPVTIGRSTFEISGIVRDGTSNGRLPNIRVSSIDSANVTRTTTTNGTGRYSIQGVAAGVVALTFSATSYLPTTQSITVAEDTQVDVSLPRDGTSTPPSTTPTLYVTVHPTTVDFGTQVVNTTSAPATVTLTNTTSAPQSPSPLMNGLHAADFAMDSNCPSTIAVGASCTFTITFKPGGTGIRHGVLVLYGEMNGAYDEIWIGLLGKGATSSLSTIPRAPVAP